MNKASCLILSGVILLQFTVGAQASQNDYPQNPYDTPSGNPYQPGEAYQMQRYNQAVGQNFPPSSPSSQGEESFMQSAQKRYQQETQNNLNMIQRDRSMIERGYDPNQTFNYGQRERLQSQPAQQQNTISYPTTHPPTTEKEVLNNAESRLRGGYSNQEPQYKPESFRNPYENPPRNSSSNQGMK